MHSFVEIGVNKGDHRRRTNEGIRRQHPNLLVPQGGTVMRIDHIVSTLALIGVATLGAGCVAHAQAGGYTEAEAPVVFASPPTLVEVDADVWVVRDYDYPVYYVGGSYWVYRNDVWWRSGAYDKGWARVDANVVPATIAHRDHHTYV